MKTYMALDGLRWSRDSGSANCDMPRSAVFGRPGGGNNEEYRDYYSPLFSLVSEDTVVEVFLDLFFVKFLANEDDFLHSVAKLVVPVF